MTFPVESILSEVGDLVELASERGYVDLAGTAKRALALEDGAEKETALLDLAADAVLYVANLRSEAGRG